MGINNPGANSVYHGVQTQSASSITNGIDVFTGGGPPPVGNFYVAENGSDFYVTEDGLNFYVTES